MNKLAEKFKKKLRPKLKEELGFKNIMAVPKVEKIIINIGLGKAVQDKKWLELAAKILERISGQKPLMIKARQSISNFKIREGNIIGAKVTLRGQRMYDFLEKLIHSALPRFKDFYGLNPQLYLIFFVFALLNLDFDQSKVSVFLHQLLFSLHPSLT